jgi:hypothetical protein
MRKKTTSNSIKMNKLNFLSNIPARERDNIVALDCEMVGSFEKKSLLARATLLNGHGHVILGKKCKMITVWQLNICR